VGVARVNGCPLGLRTAALWTAASDSAHYSLGHMLFLCVDAEQLRLTFSFLEYSVTTQAYEMSGFTKKRL